jgi:hypothetical protein
MTLDQINQREDKENASFLKWIKSPSFQLQSHESRTTDLELYMISKNREIGDLQSEIEALRKQVEILQRPLDDEIISRIIVLVKNVSDEELASNVFESVRNMTNWNKSTPAEFLVLFDKPSAQKGTE